QHRDRVRPARRGAPVRAGAVRARSRVRPLCCTGHPRARRDRDLSADRADRVGRADGTARHRLKPLSEDPAGSDQRPVRRAGCRALELWAVPRYAWSLRSLPLSAVRTRMTTSVALPGPRGLPLIGVAGSLVRDPYGSLAAIARQYGDVAFVPLPGLRL